MGTVQAVKEQPKVRKRELQASEGEREIASYFAALPPKPDWEQLIEKGTVPALILGAERRLRRGR